MPVLPATGLSGYAKAERFSTVTFGLDTQKETQQVLPEW